MNLRKPPKAIRVDDRARRRPALSQLARLSWGTIDRFDVDRHREPVGAEDFCHDLDISRFHGAARPAVP